MNIDMAPSKNPHPEARIQALRIAVLTEAAEALRVCAIVLERAAKALVEEKQ
jgi:hypothetical protein